jgi:AAA+ superfamily predicted ATPase
MVVHPELLVYDAAQSLVLRQLAGALAARSEPIVVIEGATGSGRATAAAHAADNALGGDALVLDLSRITAAEVGAGLLALRREGVLRGGLPIIANADHGLGDEQRRALGAALDSMTGPVVVTTAVAGQDLGTSRPLVRVRWPVPDTASRRALWTHFAARAGATIDGDLSDLSLRYRVGPAAIERAVASAQSHGDDGSLDATALTAGLRHNIAQRLAGVAERIEVTQTWDDLVVADDIGDQIAALVGRIRHGHQVLEQWGFRSKLARGAGVAALFSGPPGTGKTMVAGLMARELDLELYQVDLSKVVSKWIGETEKQLAQVFDAAEEGHALLLFDEADSLFGQRSSEVKGAVDRYANLEVNYLLQRVEAFGGITVLTTNLDTAIDPALKRRLAGHVVFAAPGEDERARLWKRLTNTGKAPVAADVDFEELALAFQHMSGAHIRNAALAAAFLAASEHATEIGRQHFLRAGRAEYRSMGYVLADLGKSHRSFR